MQKSRIAASHTFLYSIKLGAERPAAASAASLNNIPGQWPHSGRSPGFLQSSQKGRAASRRLFCIDDEMAGFLLRLLFFEDGEIDRAVGAMFAKTR